MNNNYRRLKGIWTALALLAPVLPFAAGFMPFVTSALFPGDNGAVAAATLIVGYAVSLGLVVFQLLLTRRIVGMQRSGLDSGPKPADSHWYWSLATVEACWVVLMTALSILGLMNVG